MTQPLGFKDLDYFGYVCKLHKAIYGLKQASRAWVDTLSPTPLYSMGFVKSRANSSLFCKSIFFANPSWTFQCTFYSMWMILFTEGDEEIVKSFIHTLNSSFLFEIYGLASLFLMHWDFRIGKWWYASYSNQVHIWSAC